MLLLCKEGHVIVEYYDNDFRDFSKIDDFKHLGLVYPFMCIFEQNLSSTEPKLLMLAYDTKMRLQYKYNASHVQASIGKKQEKILALIDSYESAMTKLETDMNSRDEYTQVLACMVVITYKTGIRIGKDIHFKTYNTVGLSTIQKKHVTFSGTQCSFDFIGKKGVQHVYVIKDKQIVQILKRLYDSSKSNTDFLFTVVTGNKQKKITYADFNEYVRSLFSSQLISGKDFRTLLANILFLSKFLSEDIPNFKKRVSESIKFVADELHNTRAVSKKSYVFNSIMEHIASYGIDTISKMKPLDVLRHIFKHKT